MNLITKDLILLNLHIQFIYQKYLRKKIYITGAFVYWYTETIIKSTSDFLDCLEGKSVWFCTEKNIKNKILKYMDISQTPEPKSIYNNSIQY